MLQALFPIGVRIGQSGKAQFLAFLPCISGRKLKLKGSLLINYKQDNLLGYPFIKVLPPYGIPSRQSLDISPLFITKVWDGRPLLIPLRNEFLGDQECPLNTLYWESKASVVALSRAPRESQPH